MYMLDRLRLLQKRNMINFALLHQRRLRAVRKCTRKGVNRIYSCLTNSFQLSRVTAIKFAGIEHLAYIQLSAKLCTMSMQIRHDRVIFIDCLFGHAKDAISTSANFTEKIYICDPIINWCQLSPLHFVSNDISKIRFVYFNQTELKVCHHESIITGCTQVRYYLFRHNYYPYNYCQVI